MADVARGPLGAGDLTERITFQSRAAGQDTLGQSNGAWSAISVAPSMWAMVRAGATRDDLAEGQAQLVTEVEFHVRFRSDLLPTMRIVWRGEPHEMMGEPIDPDGGRHRLVIRCAKGMRDGR